MGNNVKVYKGNVIFTKTPEEFEQLEGGYIVVEDGKVKEVAQNLPEQYKDAEVVDYGDKLIIPGFLDLHLHAPQFPNRGLGLDKELLPWLETYTFPEEAKFKDTEYAKKVYSRLVRELWKYGTTRSVVFSTIHKDSTKVLMDLFIEAGLGAYVGKVNMNRNSSPDLTEDTQESLRITEELLQEYSDKSPLVKPIVTPRFVPSCTPELMKDLGDLAKKYDAPVQSHLSENRGEIEWVKELHPEAKNYADVYDKLGLFGQQPTVMAHCVHVTDDEIKLMADNGVFVAHSPESNYNLSSGIAPIRKFLEAGVNVGFATDISGGHAISMMDVIAGAMKGSKMRWVYLEKEYASLSVPEVFYLATKSAGRFFSKVGKIGSFEEGYEFDALVIDDESISDLNPRSLPERLQRFLYLGDDRNIVERFVSGKNLPEPKVY